MSPPIPGFQLVPYVNQRENLGNVGERPGLMYWALQKYAIQATVVMMLLIAMVTDMAGAPNPNTSEGSGTIPAVITEMNPIDTRSGGAYSSVVILQTDILPNRQVLRKTAHEIWHRMRLSESVILEILFYLPNMDIKGPAFAAAMLQDDTIRTLMTSPELLETYRGETRYGLSSGTRRELFLLYYLAERMAEKQARQGRADAEHHQSQARADSMKSQYWAKIRKHYTLTPFVQRSILFEGMAQGWVNALQQAPVPGSEEMLASLSSLDSNISQNGISALRRQLITSSP